MNIQNISTFQKYLDRFQLFVNSSEMLFCVSFVIFPVTSIDKATYYAWVNLINFWFTFVKYFFDLGSIGNKRTEHWASSWTSWIMRVSKISKELTKLRLALLQFSFHLLLIFIFLNSTSAYGMNRKHISLWKNINQKYDRINHDSWPMGIKHCDCGWRASISSVCLDTSGQCSWCRSVWREKAWRISALWEKF